MDTETSTLVEGIEFRPPKLVVGFVDASNNLLPNMASATGIRVSGGALDTPWTFQLPPIVPECEALRMFALFGAATLARETAKRANAPAAELDARFSRVTSTTWGDEKPSKPPKPAKVKRDPLAELLDVIRTVKEALGLPFDEAATRGRLADPKFKRAARAEPHVAAEFAKREAAKLSAATAAPTSGLEAL